MTHKKISNILDSVIKCQGIQIEIVQKRSPDRMVCIIGSLQCF